MKSPATEGCACSFAVLLHLYSAISSARREGSPARSGPPPCRRLHHEAANQPHLAHADPAQPRREASRRVYLCSAHVNDCGSLQSHVCRITEGKKFGRKAGDRAYEKSKCRKLHVWRQLLGASPKLQPLCAIGEREHDGRAVGRHEAFASVGPQRGIKRKKGRTPDASSPCS
jgi:hypothetical protein